MDLVRRDWWSSRLWSIDATGWLVPRGRPKVLRSFSFSRANLPMLPKIKWMRRSGGWHCMYNNDLLFPPRLHLLVPQPINQEDRQPNILSQMSHGIDQSTDALFSHLKIAWFGLVRPLQFSCRSLHCRVGIGWDYSVRNSREWYYLVAKKLMQFLLNGWQILLKILQTNWLFIIYSPLQLVCDVTYVRVR